MKLILSKDNEEVLKTFEKVEGSFNTSIARAQFWDKLKIAIFEAIDRKDF